MIHRFIKPQIIANWLRTNYPDNPEYLTFYPFAGWMVFLADNGGEGDTIQELESSYLASLGHTEGTLHDKWKSYMDELGIGASQLPLRSRLNDYFRREIEVVDTSFLMSDTFVGTANAPVNGRTTDVGALTWGNVGANPPLLDGSGSVKLTATGQASARVLMPTGNNDVTVIALGGAGGSASSRTIAATARHTDESNHIQLYVRQLDNAVLLRKRVAGTFTTLASATSTGLDTAIPCTIRLVIVNDQVTGYVNGVSLISHTLSGGDYTLFPNTNTGVGFWFNGFTSTLVNSISAEKV